MTLASSSTTGPLPSPQPLPAAVTDQPFVSVIVPVFNDPRRLRSCLEGLERQSYPRDRYEVIVVDNGSEQPLDMLVASFSQARLVHESQPGSYAARNKGISVARGEVLAFTDSDCIPRPTWIENGVAALTGMPNCGLVGGKIEVALRDQQHPSAIELYSLTTYWQQRKFVELDHFSATANLFTFRRVLDEVGRFDDTLKSGGDAIWGQHVFAAGYRLVYADDACVDHPAMFSLRELFKRIARQAGGVSDIKKRPGAAYAAIKKERPGDFLQFAIRARLIFTDPRVPGLADRLGTLGVLLLVAFLVLLERLRLRLGGASKR